MSFSIGRYAIGLALGFLLANPAAAQEILGTWHGTLATPAGDLRLVVKVTPTPTGNLSGEIFSIDQTPAGSRMAELHVEGERLSYAVPDFGNAQYEGRWDAARHAWIGQFKQGPMTLQLVLEKGDLPLAPVIEGLDGNWQGMLQASSGTKVRLVLHVETGPRGTVGQFASPDRQAGGGVSKLHRDGSAVSFTVPVFAGEWTGTLSSDGRALSGTWTQNGRAQPLDFAPMATRTVNRPQTPKPPFPYRSEEVIVASAPGVRLAGTLTLPEGKGVFPGAVLITGSGAEDRDEAIYGHKPFLVLADYLTRHGIAVLRLDDRGFARSTGDFSKATTRDFAVDAEAAARYLRSRPEVDAAAVGFIGHSEGGLIAPMVAARDPRIAFIVLMAGPGAPMADVIMAQRAAMAPGMGKDPETVARQNAGVRRAIIAMRGARTAAEAKARAIPIMKETFPELTPGALDAQASSLSSDWMRELLAIDPRPTLRRMRIPVLALIGSHDRQVPADQNIPALRAALKGDRQATVMELPGLNHLFQTSPTGAIGEYADIEETISPAALKIISGWIAAHGPRH